MTVGSHRMNDRPSGAIDSSNHPGPSALKAARLNLTTYLRTRPYLTRAWVQAEDPQGWAYRCGAEGRTGLE